MSSPVSPAIVAKHAYRHVVGGNESGQIPRVLAAPAAGALERASTGEKGADLSLQTPEVARSSPVATATLGWASMHPDPPPTLLETNGLSGTTNSRESFPPRLTTLTTNRERLGPTRQAGSQEDLLVALDLFRDDRGFELPGRVIVGERAEGEKRQLIDPPYRNLVRLVGAVRERLR